jgi:hypothetical protein
MNGPFSIVNENKGEEAEKSTAENLRELLNIINRTS